MNERREGERRKDWKPPAYQHYAKEWLVDTAHLSLEEQGAFQRLLDHQWVNGAISDDDRERARILSVTVIGVRRIWRRIGHYFPGGLNPRLEEVRREQMEYRERKAAAGRRSGSVRNERPTEREQNANRAATEGEQNGNRPANKNEPCSLQSASAPETITTKSAATPPFRVA